MSKEAPLRIVADWFWELPASLATGLADTILSRLGLAPEPVGVEEFLRFLNAPLELSAHAGRAVCVCALIDYEMEEQGTASYWKDDLEQTLVAVERTRDPKTKTALNGSIPRVRLRGEQWTTAAAKWWDLRKSTLHHDALRAWERYAAFPPGRTEVH